MVSTVTRESTVPVHDLGIGYAKLRPVYERRSEQLQASADWFTAAEQNLILRGAFQHIGTLLLPMRYLRPRLYLPTDRMFAHLTTTVCEGDKRIRTAVRFNVDQHGIEISSERNRLHIAVGARYLADGSQSPEEAASISWRPACKLVTDTGGEAHIDIVHGAASAILNFSRIQLSIPQNT